MAKRISLTVGVATRLNYPLVHHFHPMNSRQESFNNPLSDLDFRPEAPDQFNDSANGNQGAVRALFNGWDSKAGLMTIIPLSAYAILHQLTEEDIVNACRKEREQQIAVWEADENLKGLANVAKRVWFPDGVMVDPVAIGNDCYRRSYAIMGVIYKRTLLPGFDGSLTYDIGVMPNTYSSKLEAIVDHAKENDKDRGRSEYAPLDYLKLALQIVREAGVEADLVRAGVKRGTAQKVHRVAKLDQKFPSVRLIERCFLPAPKGVFPDYTQDSYVSLVKLDKEEIDRLLKDRWYNDTEKATPINVNAAKVHEYLAAKMTGRTEKSPVMSATKLAEICDGHSCLLVRAIGKAVTSNDTAFFANLTPFHDILDSVWADILKAQGVVVPTEEAPVASEAPI